MERRGIAIILPPLEGCSEQRFGAISLSVRDFSHESADRERIVVYGGDQHEVFSDIHFQPVNIKRPRFFGLADRYLFHLFFLLRRMRPAVIEVHNRPRLAKVLVRFRIAPVTLFLHNDPRTMRRSRSPRARRWLARRLAGVFCVSHYVADCWREGLAHSSCPVYVTPLGIALPAASTIPRKKNTILFVGRIIEDKGAHEYAEALALALPDLPDWNGVVIGGRRFKPSETLSPYETQLQHLMEKAGAQAQWLGFQSHEAVMDAFAQAAIVVIPSRWEEPFGRTAIEAMSWGCAIITSGRGGLGEIIGDAGVIVEPSGRAIADAITELASNAARLRQLQEQARARAEVFAIKRCSDYLDTCRHSVMGK